MIAYLTKRDISMLYTIFLQLMMYPKHISEINMSALETKRKG
jgi:hypothetical protein